MSDAVQDEGGVLYYFQFVYPGPYGPEVDTLGPFATEDVRDLAVREMYAADIRKNGRSTSHAYFWLDIERDGDPCSGAYLPTFFAPPPRSAVTVNHFQRRKCTSSC